MLDIAQQTLKYIIIHKQAPTKNELQIWDQTLLEKKGNVFVTLYKNGEIVGSSGNFSELENNVVHEIIAATLSAYNENDNDKTSSFEAYHIRLDHITSRTLLKDKKISDLNPVQTWVLAIKKTYDKLALLLPNISTNITSGADLQKALEIKLGEDFKEENYILYELQTESFTTF